MADRYFLKGWEWGMLFLRSPSCRSSPRLMFSDFTAVLSHAEALGSCDKTRRTTISCAALLLCHNAGLQNHLSSSSTLLCSRVVQVDFRRAEKQQCSHFTDLIPNAGIEASVDFYVDLLRQEELVRKQNMQTERMRQMSDQILLVMCIKLSRDHRSESWWVFFQVFFGIILWCCWRVDVFRVGKK